MKKYVVMKLMDKVIVSNSFGEDQEVGIEGMDGFIPVFNDKEKAIEANCDGKYEMFSIELKSEEK